MFGSLPAQASGGKNDLGRREFDYIDAPLNVVGVPKRREAVPVSDRRQNLRFDKIFTVYLTTTDGMTRGIARNISARGLFVETREPVPLGGRVRVTFAGEDGTELSCLCEVRYQVALSYGTKGGVEGNSRGMGLRILSYDARDEAPLIWVDREKVLH